MRRVDVEALPERERDGVVVERRVGRGVVHGDRGVGEACNELLDPADALHARDGGAEGGAIPVRQ